MSLQTIPYHFTGFHIYVKGENKTDWLYSSVNVSDYEADGVTVSKQEENKITVAFKSGKFLFIQSLLLSDHVKL